MNVAWKMGLVMVALWAAGCDKASQLASKTTKSSKTGTTTAEPAVAGVEARLLSGPWVGMLDHKAIQVAFDKKRKQLTAEIRYLTFGNVYATDKVDVTIDATGNVTLTGTPKNPLVGAPESKLPALVGKLSDDKTELGGAVGATPATWSVTTSKSIVDVTKPFDAAEAEKALLSGQWEGKISGRPGKLVVTRKKGALVGKLTRGNEVSTVAVVVVDGKISLKAQPIPTSAGLLKQNGGGFFLNDNLDAMMGSYHIETTQGFMTSSSTESWRFDNLKAGALATAKTKSKKK